MVLHIGATYIGALHIGQRRFIGCRASDFYLPSKVKKINGGSSTFPKQGSTLVDFGMSWSHLSASGHTFSETVTPLTVRAYFFPKMSFSITPLRVRAWARMPLVYLLGLPPYIEVPYTRVPVYGDTPTYGYPYMRISLYRGTPM